jgi:hypothetical protein
VRLDRSKRTDMGSGSVFSAIGRQWSSHPPTRCECSASQLFSEGLRGACRKGYVWQEFGAWSIITGSLSPSPSAPPTELTSYSYTVPSPYARVAGPSAEMVRFKFRAEILNVTGAIVAVYETGYWEWFYTSSP